MLEDIIAERRKKLEEYKKDGYDPYPAKVKRDFTIAEFLNNFDNLEKEKKSVCIVGRIFAWRDQGKIIFADVKDESGKTQIIFNEKEFAHFDVVQKNFDIGDFTEVCGTAWQTQRGEKSLLVKTARMIAKGLRPIPSEWYGIEDQEKKFRQRYLDLLINENVRDLFVKKAKFWGAMRKYLEKSDFLEVETPVLEPIPGGAEAEPFRTHHNALDEDFYLRISPELNLKKLIVGGFEKIFEIGRIFRNEGIDAEHLQDYTQMEMYWAYQDYDGLMKFLEKMLKKVILTTVGGYTTDYQGQKIEWNGKWPKLDYYKLFKKENGIDLKKASDEVLFKKASELNLENATQKLSRGRLIDLIYKKTVRPKLIQPAFLVNPPIEVEPLAKRWRKDDLRVERFQIVACGTELGKGFSELNDPLDQRTRFEEQMKLRESGDKEAQMFDENYVEAMEYGMPPTAGFGISERFFAILMNKPVRETVFFPLMRRSNRE